MKGLFPCGNNAGSYDLERQINTVWRSCVLYSYVSFDIADSSSSDIGCADLSNGRSPILSTNAFLIEQFILKFPFTSDNAYFCPLTKLTLCTFAKKTLSSGTRGHFRRGRSSVRVLLLLLLSNCDVFLPTRWSLLAATVVFLRKRPAPSVYSKG